MNRQKIGWLLGLILFLLGMLLGLAFNTLAVYTDLEGMSFWGSPEATSFDPSIETQGELGSLRCPVIIGKQEQALVYLTVRNPEVSAIRPWVQASLSDPTQNDNATRNKQQLSLAAREKVVLSWSVDVRNLLYNRVIYVRTFLLQTQFHPPSLTRHCGIMVVDLGGLTGAQITTGVSILSLGSMGLGILLWRHNRPGRTRRENRGVGIMAWLAGITGANIAANLSGGMVLAGLLLILTVLLFIAILENAFIHRG